VLYVYCHGVHESGAIRPGALASESALSFSVGERIRIADMRRLPGGTLPDHALVFLNACEGATQQAFYYDGFMPFFIEECGACGFIGTEVKTPVLLAHDLAQHFMRLFVQGGSVGQILWRLRRHYLKNHHTILGFNYTLYGLDELKLARPTRTDQQHR
jgi:CHAT domain